MGDELAPKEGMQPGEGRSAVTDSDAQTLEQRDIAEPMVKEEGAGQTTKA